MDGLVELNLIFYEFKLSPACLWSLLCHDQLLLLRRPPSSWSGALSKVGAPLCDRNVQFELVAVRKQNQLLLLLLL